MKTLGKVINFSPKGSLVVRCKFTPSIGSVVVDRKGEVIGKVIRVTGPVVTPFALVKPRESGAGTISSLGGRELFLGQRPQKSGPDRRGRVSRRPGNGARKPESRGTGGSARQSDRNRRSGQDKDHGSRGNRKKGGGGYRKKRR